MNADESQATVALERHEIRRLVRRPLGSLAQGCRRVPGLTWIGLAAWNVFWAATNYRHMGGSWHYFRQGARLLFHPGTSGGLRIYATHPWLQIGPLSFVAAAPFSVGPVAVGRLAAVSVMTAAGLRAIAIATATSHIRAGLARRVRWAGLLFLPVWTELGTSTGHLDDVLAVVLALLAVRAASRARPVLTGLLLAGAVDAKPWAFGFVAVLLCLHSGQRIRAALAFAVGVGCAWLPFVFADPHTLNAARFAIPNAAASALRALGFHNASTPWWDRSAQILLGATIAAVVVRRSGAAAALVAVIAVRLILDPAVYSYYTSGLMAMTMAYDVISRRRTFPWTTASVLTFLYLPSIFVRSVPSASSYSGDLRAAYLICLLGYLVVARIRAPSEPPAGPHHPPLDALATAA
ncbi:MAG TPA: hypothetical protein VFN80_10125 [Acidothermaceae bacterium]|nr:hypothetical protein [Acidothermaceae bacterium]